jgi:hypothetical protein
MIRKPKKIEAVFYKTAAGSEPVRDWLMTLSGEDRRRAGFDIATCRIRLARRYAALQVARRWTLGNPKRPFPRQDRAGDFLYRAGANGASARFRQEVSKGAEDRSGRGTKETKEYRTMSRKHIGSSFDAFLEEEGIHDAAHAHAIKRVVAWQIEEAMKMQSVSKVEMAKRMKTSRAQLDRLLDPENDKVQLDTLQRAATAVGKKLRLEII